MRTVSGSTSLVEWTSPAGADGRRRRDEGTALSLGRASDEPALPGDGVEIRRTSAPHVIGGRDLGDRHVPPAVIAGYGNARVDLRDDNRGASAFPGLRERRRQGFRVPRDDGVGTQAAGVGGEIERQWFAGVAPRGGIASAEAVECVPTAAGPGQVVDRLE